MIVLSLATVVLAAIVAGLVVILVRERRERREALDLVGAAADADLPSAIRRELRRRVSRDELSATLFSREAVLEASPVPVLVLDGRGVVARANRAARAAFGAVGGSTADEIAPSLGAAVRRVLAGPPTEDVELVFEEPVRRTFEVHLRSHPDGSERGVVAVLIDVSAAVDFRESRRLFSAAVSHELRTPLARILGLAETMGLPQSDEERGALIAQTEIEVDNMRRLIDEMLLLAALDRGGVAEGIADAGAVVESVVSDRHLRPASRGRSITAEGSRGLTVPIRGQLLEVVVGNLVDNALRHAGPHATVAVAVRGLAGEVEITVRDSGVGIAPEHLPHIFERFYRAEASRHGPGTGLGLAIVKHIVEAHGGRVAVESRSGAGTSVRLVLPEVVSTPIAV